MRRTKVPAKYLPRVSLRSRVLSFPLKTASLPLKNSTTKSSPAKSRHFFFSFRCRCRGKPRGSTKDSSNSIHTIQAKPTPYDILRSRDGPRRDDPENDDHGGPPRGNANLHQIREQPARGGDCCLQRSRGTCGQFGFGGNTSLRCSSSWLTASSGGCTHPPVQEGRRGVGRLRSPFHCQRNGN